MNAFGFVISFALFCLGLYLMGVAFNVPQDMALFTFGGGILTVAAGIAIPVHIMHRVDR